MNKELEEAFGLIKRVCELYIESRSYLTGSDIIENQINEALNTIKNRLEVTDNAESSEALECLEYLYCNPEDYRSTDKAKDYNTVKNYILKAQEQEKENELLKEIIKSLFDRGCPLHQYTDKDGMLLIEVDNECSTMHLGKFKDVDLDAKLKEVLE